MRKITTVSGTFYYPELSFNLIDTDELKIIVENPAGYVAEDLVRMFYTFDLYNIQVGVNTFEMFSPLVQDGSILRAVFYLPLSAGFANDIISFDPNLKLTEYFIKTKGSTDFTKNTNVLFSGFSYIYLTNSDLNVRSSPIPVFFFSERGAGLFENKILNRQFRTADTNFSSVAIRQYKFNPHDMGVGGRNLWEGTEDFSGSNWLNKDKWSLSGGLYKGFTVAYRAAKFAGLSQKLSVKGGEVYTYSAFVKRDAIDNKKIQLPIVSKNDSSIIYYSYNNNFGEFNEGNSDEWYRVWGVCNIVRDDDVYIRLENILGGEGNLYIAGIKLEKGNKATAWTPAPEDYEITEVVSNADLSGGKTEFNSSYAFKLLDDSEWVTKKLVCPENYIQLFWGEPRSATRFSFWFKIKEIEKSSEEWGEVEHDRELRAGRDVKERRKDVTKYRFPKTKLKLTSGVFRKDIIDKLKGIAHSPAIYKYNPYTKLNEGRGVVAQVTEVRSADGSPTEQVSAGHFKLDYANNFSNTIEELIDSPESVFDLEFTFKGTLANVHFLQNKDDLSKSGLISGSITETSFTKKTFNGSIVIDRSIKVKPLLRFGLRSPGFGEPLIPAEIKDIYIKGSLGGIEDVEVEIATMNIIPHQDGESEMELTVISDDFRKPDYLYF